ncbi:MAG: hypothetical protein IKK21_05285, partial [Clostridia bacterium]|nr:hypothetical protein [Clostridia bacterium]
MKKVIALFMIVCLLTAMIPCAYAVQFPFGYKGNIWSFSVGDAKLNTRGDGKSASVFFVTTSYTNGKITLKQSKGTCTLLSYAKLISGIKGTAKEWGKYTITVYHAESATTKQYNWSKTYNNDSYTLKLPKAGNYYIVVRPFTAQQMTKSYLCDRFISWNKAP